MSFLDKLAKIEALIQRASLEGERQAAQLAKERIIAKLSLNQSDELIEYRISLGSSWEKRLFIALCRKHGFQTYRYPKQKYTTARLKISKSIMDEILWPEYQRYFKMLQELIEDIMQNLINKIHNVQDDEMVIMGEIGFKEA
jgi:hypothetical protein